MFKVVLKAALIRTPRNSEGKTWFCTCNVYRRMIGDRLVLRGGMFVEAQDLAPAIIVSRIARLMRHLPPGCLRQSTSMSDSNQQWQWLVQSD